MLALGPSFDSAYHREIAAAPDPDAKRRELEDMLAAKQSPFPRAEAFAVHVLPSRLTPAQVARLTKTLRRDLELNAAQAA